MINSWYKKGLVFGIVCLFIGVGFSSSIAVDVPKNKGVEPQNIEVEPQNIEVEPKDYFFETIIKMANNPDVKALFDQAGNNNEFFDSNYNFRSIFLNLLFRNPRLLLSIIFTRPSLTVGYLDKTYNQGVDLVNILGEDEAIDMYESIEITDIEFINSLSNIIENDKELSNRISTLGEMNNELNLDDPFWRFPIICTLLLITMGVIAVAFALWVETFDLLPPGAFIAFLMILAALLAIPAGFGFILNCFWVPPLQHTLQ